MPFLHNSFFEYVLRNLATFQLDLNDQTSPLFSLGLSHRFELVLKYICSIAGDDPVLFEEGKKLPYIDLFSILRVDDIFKVVLLYWVKHDL